MKPAYDLSGRTVLISGASRGLGLDLVRAVRARGAKIALLDDDFDAVMAQAGRVASPEFARGWAAAVRSLESVLGAVDAAAEHFGGIDVVIAAACASETASMAGIDPAAFERIVDVNLVGTWRTFRAALPLVQERKGYLMAISSMAAFVPAPLHGAYAASKAGAWAMCNSLRMEVHRHGVGVGSAHPAYVKTPVTDEALHDAAGNVVWSGDEPGLWTMIPFKTIVEDIVCGIEAREDVIVSPRSNVKSPGLVCPFTSRFAIPEITIPGAGVK